MARRGARRRQMYSPALPNSQLARRSVQSDMYGNFLNLGLHDLKGILNSAYELQMLLGFGESTYGSSCSKNRVTHIHTNEMSKKSSLDCGY